MSIKQIESIITEFCKKNYSDRLCSLVFFGSYGRGVARPDSDVDFLLVVKDLPNGRISRVEEFLPIEREILSQIIDSKYPILLSPIFKTPAELALKSPILLDMTEDSKIAYDPQNVFLDVISDLKESLKKYGARRVVRGTAWWWDLKPDFKPGDVVKL